MEIVKLIGEDVLHDEQKLTLEIAKIIRQGFLQQNAYHPADTYVPLDKQYRMMKLILYLNEKAKDLVARQIPISYLRGSGIFEEIIKVKYEIGNDEPEKFEGYHRRIDTIYHELLQKQA